MPVSRLQVEMQLKRMMGSESFRGGKHLAEQPNAARLLTYLVKGTLDDKVLKETEVLSDFYGLSGAEIAQDPTRARTDVHRLRKKLAGYYKGTGKNDPVVIAIPKGKYRADFSLNPNSEARQQVALGFAHVDEENPEHIKQALIHFENAVKLEPSLADAWAGMASAYLTMTLHAFSDDPVALFAEAEEAADKAVSLDESCWRGHANQGAVYLFRHEWMRADEAFGVAKRLAPLEISDTGGYGPYLLSRGHFAEARKLADHYTEVGFDNVILLCRAGLYLYALREFDDARDVLSRACSRNRNFWRSHLILAYTYLSLGEPEKAMEQMDEVRYCARADLWPGMRILCLESASRPDEAEAEFNALLELKKSQYVQPVQTALGRMALGDIEGAVADLSVACDVSDPFTCWLHLWAFLDPVRGSRSFRDLLRRRKFNLFKSPQDRTRVG